MRNRAKCKLCLSIIESFHATDYVECKCGEIIVDGGEALRCAATNWENFLRVDDEGNEIIIKLSEPRRTEPSDNTDNQDQNSPSADTNHKEHRITREQLLGMLSEMIRNIEHLPVYAMGTPITHYDFSSLLILLAALFRTESCKDDI
jgi:hypothetical protein